MTISEVELPEKIFSSFKEEKSKKNYIVLIAEGPVGSLTTTDFSKWNENGPHFFDVLKVQSDPTPLSQDALVMGLRNAAENLESDIYLRKIQISLQEKNKYVAITKPSYRL